MTRVDFYLLADDSTEAKLAFACKLVSKTVKLGHRIYIHCQDRQQTAQLSQQLWHFDSHSFLAHEVIESPQKSEHQSAIQLGCLKNPQTQHHDLLINLCKTVPDYFASFNRLSEIVVQAPDELESGRSRYKFYQSKHFPLHQHDLRKNAL